MSYRTLKHGEEAPSFAPRRYRDACGYVILRWKVAPGQYVEAKEHRFVMGMPPAGFDVHHVNGIKDDNRIENLRVLRTQDHKACHVHPSWDVSAAMRDYSDGMSFPQLGNKYGVNAVTVLRVFKVRGFKSRPSPANKTHCNQGHEFSPENTYRWSKKPNSRACKACARLAMRRLSARRRDTERINLISEQRGV